METRTFECRVQEGTYRGTVTVTVDAEAVERGGNEFIRARALQAWRQQFGPGLGMAYLSIIINEVTP